MDAVIIAVQDRLHADVVEAFAALGYVIICEKPIATSIDHCLKIEAAMKKASIIFGMGHGARFLSIHCHVWCPRSQRPIPCQCYDIRRTHAL